MQNTKNRQLQIPPISAAAFCFKKLHSHVAIRIQSPPADPDMLNVLQAIRSSCKAHALFLTGLLCFVQTVSAQLSGQFFLQYLDNRSGLSNSAINDVFKDSDNLLWIATWDGLNMYDGSAFHVFNYGKENDPRSIGNNVIKHIAEDKREEYLDQHHRRRIALR